MFSFWGQKPSPTKSPSGKSISKSAFPMSRVQSHLLKALGPSSKMTLKRCILEDLPMVHGQVEPQRHLHVPHETPGPVVLYPVATTDQQKKQSLQAEANNCIQVKEKWKSNSKIWDESAWVFVLLFVKVSK